MGNSIKVKNYSDVFEEFPAVAALYPGHLLMVTSANKVQKHNVASGNILPMVAIEDALQGKGITEAYAADDIVRCWIPTRGCIVKLRLKDGQTVVVGDWVESAGDGTVQKWVVDSTGDYFPAQLVGQVVEAVDMSGSSGVDPDGFVNVRIN